MHLSGVHCTSITKIAMICGYKGYKYDTNMVVIYCTEGLIIQVYQL